MKKRLYTPILVLVLTVLFIIYSDYAAESALSAMKNSMQKIIPALFPFMIISSMIVSSGTADILGRLFPISRLFSLPKCASAPIIIGALCGFPLGAKTATELYTTGYLSKTETEVLISIANNTGPTFLIFVIGRNLWADTKFGVFLYVSQLITSFVSALVVNRLVFPIKEKNYATVPTIIVKPIFESLSQAVSSAVISSINICGYITFFAVINAIISKILISAPVNLLLFSKALLEFTEAAADSAVYQSVYSAFTCGFAVGWSGLSVFCQTAGFTTPLGLSLKRCIITKLLQGTLLGASCILYNNFLSHKKIEFSFFEYNFVIISTAITLSLLLAAVYVIYYRKKHKGA